MESCLEVTYEKQESVQSVDTTALIVSGVIGLLVGIILGLIVLIKCCGSKFKLPNVNKTDAIIAKSDEEKIVEDFSQSNDSYIHDSVVTKHQKVEKSISFEGLSEDLAAMKKYKKQFSPSLAKIGIKTKLSWDAMILELGKKELFELWQLEISCWEERHTIVLQCYTVHLNILLSKKYIAKHQYSQIYSSEEEALCTCLKEFREFTYNLIDKMQHGNAQSLCDEYLHAYSEYMLSIKRILCAYNDSPYKFLNAVRQYLPKEYIVPFQQEILFRFDEIESLFRKNQNDLNEAVHQAYLHIRNNTQQLMHAVITETEVMQSQQKSCDQVMERLVKTGRISSTTKERVTDLMTENHFISDKILEVLSDIHPLAVAYFEKSLMQHEDGINNITESLTVHSKSVSMENFAVKVLTAYHQQKVQKFSLLKSISDREFDEIKQKLDGISKSLTDIRKEQLSSFCQLLIDQDAVSSTEAQSIHQGFSSKLESSYNQVYETCQKSIDYLWELYDNHWYEKKQEENAVQASILQDTSTDHLLSVEDFLSLQITLSNEDRTKVFHARDSIFLLLVNQVHNCQMHWFQVLENDLAKCQAFLMSKKTENLSNGSIPELLEVIDRLWQERNVMQNFVTEAMTVNCIKSILDMADEFLSRRIAYTFANKSLKQEIAVHKEEIYLDSIAERLSGVLKAKHLEYARAITDQHCKHLNGQLVQLLEDNEDGASQIDESIGASYAKRHVRLSAKADKISQHTPRGGNPGDMRPFLEQLLLQYQMERKLESEELDKCQDMITRRQSHDTAVAESIKDHSRASQSLFLCKLAALAGLEKSEFIKLASVALKESEASQAKAKLIQQRLQNQWRAAVATRDQFVGY